MRKSTKNKIIEAFDREYGSNADLTSKVLSRIDKYDIPLEKPSKFKRFIKRNSLCIKLVSLVLCFGLAIFTTYLITENSNEYEYNKKIENILSTKELSTVYKNNTNIDIYPLYESYLFSGSNRMILFKGVKDSKVNIYFKTVLSNNAKNDFVIHFNDKEFSKDNNDFGLLATFDENEEIKLDFTITYLDQTKHIVYEENPSE